MTTIRQDLKLPVELKPQSSNALTNEFLSDPKYPYRKYIDYKDFHEKNMEIMKDTYFSKKSPDYRKVKKATEKAIDDLTEPSDFGGLLKKMRKVRELNSKKDKIAATLNKGFKKLFKTPEGRAALKKDYDKEVQKIPGTINKATSAIIKEELAEDAKIALAKKPTVHTLQETKQKAVVSKFEKIAKEKYGVNARYSSKDPLKAFWINKALEKINKAGFDLKGLNIKTSTSADKKVLETGMANGTVLGATLAYTPNVYLRKNSKNGLNWGRYKFFNDGQASSLKPDHTPIHEIGHYLNFKELEKDPKMQVKHQFFKLNKETQEEISKKVSDYGASQPCESVAEIFAGVIEGKPFDKKTMDVYKAFKGATNEKFEGLVQKNAAKAKATLPKYASDDIVIAQNPGRAIVKVVSTIGGMAKKAKTTDDIDKLRALSDIRFKMISGPFGMSRLGLNISDVKLSKVVDVAKKLK